MRHPRGKCLLYLCRGISVCAMVFIGFTSILQAQIVGIQTRAFSSPPDFQMWAEISTGGQLFSTGLLYGDGTPNTFTGGLWGLTILGDEYFATEFVDGAGGDCRLVKIAGNGLLTQAQRVGTASIGFPAVECLAASGDEIFGMSVNYESHRSSLISINPESGLGTMVGPGDFDVIIVGLAYHPVLGKLFGAGIPFGSVQEHNLYEINIENGSTTLIGALGAEIHGLAYHNEIGLIGVFQKLYSIDTNTGNASVVNEEANFSHDGNPSNGLYTLAAHSGSPPHAFPPFHILSVSLIDESAILIKWESEAAGRYIIQSAQTLSPAALWENASGEIVAQGTVLQHTMSINEYPQQVIRVIRVE